MTSELLQTKLFIPPLRPDNISRSRLLRKLDHGLHKSRAQTNNERFITIITAKMQAGLFIDRLPEIKMGIGDEDQLCAAQKYSFEIRCKVIQQAYNRLSWII